MRGGHLRAILALVLVLAHPVPTSRVLGSDDVNAGNDYLSNEWCAQLCHNAGLALAGTEYGGQCFCGNALRAGTRKAPSSECNTPCAGYANETCGGAWRINVFAVNCFGSPVKPPPELPWLVNPCLSLPYSLMPFCNTTLAYDVRIDDAISRMTLSDKIASMSTDAPAIAGLGLPRYNWWSEATHGIMMVRADAKTPYATNMAFPITTAMSFNRSLWWHTGSQIAHEARAFMNAGNAYSTYWAPVINLAREPRWGRNLECAGEDPMLTGEYAIHFVKGFQEAPEDASHVLASACCKHFVANSMEDTNQNGIHNNRESFDASVPMQDLLDSYMPPFQSCVELGGVTSLMCSYNSVNGVPSCANDWLLKQVARGDWGFDGYITSDCDADYDVFFRHNYTKTPEEAVRDVLRAGTDVDCGGFVTQYAASALQKGVISEHDLDERLRNLFRVRLRLGHFDPPGPLQKIPTTAVCSDYAKALARDGVVQSAVLIKNDGAALPFADSKAVYAVVGPNALLSKAVAGYYGPNNPCDMKFWTVLDAVAQYTAAAPLYSIGVANVTTNDTSAIPAAVEVAKQADHVVLVLGTDLTWAAEGHDAKSILFSGGQLALVEQVAQAARLPVVVVLITATPLDLTPLLSNPKVGAVLHVGMPSVQTLGIGDLLFGKRSPAGRMIQTVMPKSYQDEISIFDFNMRPGPSAWPRPDCATQPQSLCPNGTNPGRTYRFYTGNAVVPFGFGLSYTTFAYTSSAASDTVSLRSVHDVLVATGANHQPSLRKMVQPMVQCVVNVTNNGAVDADDVVLGFLTPPGAGVNGMPLRYLFGFERVHVKAGQTVSVFLYPQMRHFVHHLGVDGQRRVVPGHYTVEFGIREMRAYGQYARHALSATLDE